MFTKLVPISPAEDAKTRLNIVNDWSFAKDATAVPVGLEEARELASEYVLAFANDPAATPICILGGENRNNYINEAGQWNARRIPAAMRAYPFTAMTSDDGKRLGMLRDGGAPHFAGSDGEPLFDAEGKAGPAMQNVSRLLAFAFNDVVAAKAQAAALRDAGVLEEVKLKAQMSDGTERVCTGFQIINKEKLTSLTGEAKEKLEASGALALAQIHLRSLEMTPRLFSMAPAVPAAEQPSEPAAAPAAKAEKPAKAVAKPAKAASKPAAAAAAKKPASKKR